MSGFTRREGSDDTRDVAGQASVGLSHMTQSRPVPGGTLQTDKAADGVGGSWTRVTLTPDEIPEDGDLFACYFGDPTATAAGIDTAPFVYERSEATRAPFRKTRLAAQIWPRGGGITPPSGPCAAYPLDQMVGAGLQVSSVVPDLGEPDTIVPRPGYPGLYVSSLTTDVQTLDLDTQQVRTKLKFPAPRYIINHGINYTALPFVHPFHAGGRAERETWGVGFVGANYARRQADGRFAARFCDPPKVALFRGARAPTVLTLPDSGNASLGDLPSATTVDGSAVVVDLNDAYLAPVVVATAPGCFVAIVVRGRGNVDPASRDTSGTRFGYFPLPVPRCYWSEDGGQTWQERNSPGWSMELYVPWGSTDGGFSIPVSPTITNPQALRSQFKGVPWTKESALFAGFFMDASNASRGGAWKIFTAGKTATTVVHELPVPAYQLDIRHACRPRGAAVFAYYARAHLDTFVNNTTTGVPTPGQPAKFLTGEFNYLYARLRPNGDEALIDDTGGYLDRAGVIVVQENGDVVMRPFPWSRLAAGPTPSVFCLDQEGRDIGTIVWQEAEGQRLAGWYLFSSRDLGQTWTQVALVTSRCPGPRQAYEGQTGPSYPDERAIVSGSLPRLNGDSLTFNAPGPITPLRINGATARAFPGAPWLYQ